MSAFVELTEAELVFRFGAGLPDDIGSSLGVTVARFGGGVLCSMTDSLSGGGWSRSIGLGVTEPVTGDLIGDTIDFHRRHGSPQALIQIAPELLPPDWDDICSAYGLTVGDGLVRLVCDIEDFTPGGSYLRVDLISREELGEWTALIASELGPNGKKLAPMFAAVVGNPHFRSFAAWDDEELVAVGNLFLHGEGASFITGITKPSHRGRGAQSALIAARARVAAEAGCRWLTAATVRPTEEKSVTSYNNLVRAGFSPLYHRPDWIWRPGRGASPADSAR
ncbi:GNAT family N-acetyltransferase [Micromonospora sp. NPDC050397]|uniref:GNAT family N-acetyltransferase n=1 Tax=Micromonospora sp. NPDC050397 TaxID=3364279 RepID=UPI00384C5414